MSQPAWSVDDLFGRLALRYGEAFLRQYDGLSTAAVKADWAHVLSGFSAASIGYGLQNLPADRPPNALQFRRLCNGSPLPEYRALPAPVSGPTAAVRAKLQQLRGRITGSPAPDRTEAEDAARTAELKAQAAAKVDAYRAAQR